MSDTDERTVCIVDDDEAVRDSIKELVESVGLNATTFASPIDFLESGPPNRFDCLVLDVRMAGMSGLELQQQLKEQGVSTPVIVITGHGDVPMAVKALQSGAADFIEKPYRDQTLFDSINKALEKRISENDDNFTDRLAALTPRELQVYEQLLDGDSSKKIAKNLGVSPRTVETHRHNLLQKLGFDSVKDVLVARSAPAWEE